MEDPENYEWLMEDIPKIRQQHPGGTCVFRGVGYCLEKQWNGFLFNDQCAVDEYEAQMMVPLFDDQNLAIATTVLNMFRDVGLRGSLDGLERRFRIAGYQCHPPMLYTDVFRMMKSGTVFLGTFPVRPDDFDTLGSDIYRLTPPRGHDEVLPNHLVTFFGHGKEKGEPFLIFLKKCGSNRFGRIYFSQVYQIPHLPHFRFISANVGPRPHMAQVVAPPPPLGIPQPRGPSRPPQPSESQSRSPAQPQSTRGPPRQHQVAGQRRCTAYDTLAKCAIATAVRDWINLGDAHQREGLRWLWVLHCKGTGGILGDDTGLGKTMQELREQIKPYFLRRMKSEVFADTGLADDKKLSKKNELIVWLKLTACQRKLYEAFLNSDIVHSPMQGSSLAAITILKKICDHPIILTKRAAEDILEGMDGMLDNQDMGMVQKKAMNLADMAYDDEALQVEEEISCKLSFIKSLLRKFLEEEHHVLIFSQTCKMLNLIQEAILLEGYRFLHIDGTTKERERIVKDFQEGSRAQIFLLTTRVGGLGLTLTKAARVIVVDPAWNPSTDNQAVDRAYRIGQTKEVIVYRLMTCGTIEEKIYKLQVFKGALFRTAIELKEQTRYFSKRDMQEIFSLPEQGFDVSLTQKQLQEEHGQQLVMDDPLMTEHIEFLEQQGIAGVSNHSLLFTKTAVLPMLSEHDALDSKPPSMPMMARQYNKASSSDYVANGAAHAFKPKDFTPRAYFAANSTNSESPEEIKANINRLSQTLANMTLVSKLPDRGEELKKQIHALDEKLTVIESSPESAVSSRGARDEVIRLDDQKYYGL